MPTHLLRHITPERLMIGAGALATIGVVSSFVLMGHAPAAAAVAVVQGPIVAEIDTTGTVKAADSIDLSFDISGRISYAGPTVGTRVHAGQTLALLAGGDAAAAVAQAQAARAVQEARLDGLKAGARTEDVAVSQAGVDSATANLAEVKQSLITAGHAAFVASDDAVRNKVDQFISNPRSLNPQLVFTLPDASLALAILNGRSVIEPTLAAWQHIAAAPPTPDTLDARAYAADTRTRLTETGAYLDTVASGLSILVSSAQTPLTTVQKYQGDVATGRNAISGALSALNAADAAESAAESALTTARAQLALKTAGASSQDLAAQQALVAQAAANLQAAQVAAAKTALRAPIAGTITRNDAHEGQTALPSLALISLDSDASYEIESYVSEADFARVHAGQEASITFDAYPSAVFDARVVSIDPAATMQNGVASYKVTLAFVTPDARIKAGLTANVSIATGSAQDALLVPSTALITKGAAHYVLAVGAHGDVLTPVTIGFVGTSTTQILSGVAAGDLVRGFGTQ